MNVILPISDIRRCAKDSEFVSAVKILYKELDRQIAEHGAVCRNRGLCCKFEDFGHNLFVSSVEMAYFLAVAGDPLLVPPDRSFCPYQAEGECTARSARPAGCRIFFCDSAAQEWQGALTEDSLKLLSELGTRYKLPYTYLEWTDGLRQMGGRIVERRSGS